MHENDILASLPKLFATRNPNVLTGSGPDDCAHLLVPGKRLAASTDAFAENSHFTPDTPPRLVAKKCLVASLSDLAASGCLPQFALVSLCLKKGLPENWAAEFAQALAETARQYDTAIVGGDIVAAKEAVVVAVTVLGFPLAGGPLLRSGGRPGDVVTVTGELGGSLLGKHLEPTARFKEISLFMQYCRERNFQNPGAAMDISDGLALDLSRLCRESGVGAEIEAARIPVSEAAKKMAATSGQTPLDHALADGEDFELILVMRPEIWAGFAAYYARQGQGLAPFTCIGRLTGGRDLRLIDDRGEGRPLAAKGYEHTW